MISVFREDENKPRIDTSELIRVFGELQGYTKRGNSVVKTGNSEIHEEVTGYTHEIYTLKQKVAVLEAKNEGFDRLTEELKEQLSRERSRLATAEERALSAENKIMGLLENNSQKEKHTHNPPEAPQKEFLETIKAKKDFWSRVKAVFIG